MTNSSLHSPSHQPNDLMPHKAQAKASDPKTSVWVNASAGSGKTTVLTSRVIRLLLSGVAPERIIGLTFTRAAAAEMSIRITEKLGHWTTCSDDELRADLDRLQDVAPHPQQLTTARRLFAQVLNCPGGLRIRTIHAFCQEILRRFPIEAGVQPHFTLIEEADATEMQDEALTKLLRLSTQNPHAPLSQDLLYLVTTLGEKGLTSAVRDILNHRDRFGTALKSAGSCDALISQIHSKLKVAPQETIASFLKRSISCLPEDALKKAAQDLLKGTKTYVDRGTRMLAWLALPPEARILDFANYTGCFLTKDGDLFARYGDTKLLKDHPELDSFLKREAEHIKTIQEEIEIIDIALGTGALIRFGAELMTQYEARKTARAALDYNDLVIRTDALLRREGIAPWILFKLDGGLDHILVDEAQDTSYAQWRIVSALVDEFFSGSSARPSINRTLFVVGDEKQSIFSFQNADPDAFLNMRRFFADRIRSAEKDYHEQPLRISFRSAPVILRAVDAVFTQDHARSGVTLDPVQHSAFHHNKCGRVEVWDLLKSPKKNDDKSLWSLPLTHEDEEDPQARLADIIADTIQTWTTKGEILVGENRPINAGDIMILLRRRGRFADLMVRALKKRDVAVTGVDRMRLIQQLPVMDLLALMQFVLLPEDSLTLATVLRGPLLNMSEEQLMLVALDRGEKTLWQSLILLAHNDPAFGPAVQYLTDFLNIADRTTPFAFLTRLLLHVCPGSSVSGRHALWQRLGPDSLDPLEELLTAAQAFSHRHTPSLQAFLHWLTLADAEIKRELDRGHGRDGGQVRIMTVHASKGLEAPIVFLPDAASTPRVQDIPNLLWHEDLPFHIPHKPASGLPYQLWKTARTKQMEEYRRLLYVALTRASHRLYIGGCEPAKNEADRDQSWYHLVSSGLMPHHMPSAVTEAPPLPIIVLTDPSPPTSFAHPIPMEKAPPDAVLPPWVRKPAPLEAETLSPLTPSLLSTLPGVASPDVAFARGRLIHRLLQSLPDIREDRRDAVTARFLANPQFGLSVTQQSDVADEVLKLLRNPEFAPLFGPHSRAEVSIVGRMGCRTVPGQIDRLSIQDDSVWIVDYKTNRPPPLDVSQVPEAYRLQLAAYRSVLKDVYVNKTIRCFLLWTYVPLLMPIPDTLLALPAL